MNRHALAAVLVAVVVLLAGCGGPDGGPGADNETDTELVDGEETETELVDGGTETPPEAVTAGDAGVPRAPDVGLVTADG